MSSSVCNLINIHIMIFHRFNKFSLIIRSREFLVLLGSPRLLAASSSQDVVQIEFSGGCRNRRNK